MTLAGNIQGFGNATFVAGGDLTLQPGFALNNGLDVVFASTGGVFNNLAGVSAVQGSNGKLRIYSSTNGTGSSGTAFNDGGLASGAPTFSGVSYPANPDAADTAVEYFLTTSSLPTLSITANSFSRNYGQADPTFTATYTGGSGGGASELTALPSFRVLQGSDVNAGTYTIQPFGAASAVDLLRYIDGTLTVNPLPLTIAANPASMTYGGAIPGFTSNISGFVNGDTAALVSGLTLGSNAGANPPAGSYTITPSGAVVAIPPGGVEPNYTVNYVTSTLTVNPAPLTVSAIAANASYGSAIPSLGLNFSGFVNAGDAATVPNEFAAVTSARQGSGVGTYPITLANGNPNGDYIVTFNGANLSITPVPLTITPNVSRLYGANLPSILPAADFAGFVAGDTPASMTTQPALNTAATIASNVGRYAITASGAVNPNYTISYTPGTLSVTPAPLLITANDVARNYGSASPGLTASYSGLVNGDPSSVVSGLSLATTSTSASNVGRYTIAPSGGVASNYTISYANGTLTVNPVPLEIIGFGTRTYGASNSTIAVSLSLNGLVNGDTVASLTKQPTVTTNATPASSVGIYSLLLSGAVDPNYTIRYQPGDLTIQPAVLTLMPISTTSMYGSPVTPPDVNVTGLVNGDTIAGVFRATPTASTLATSSSPVGIYASDIASTFLASDDYILSFKAGTVEITPAPLSIAANNANTAAGSAVPTLTGTFHGLVNGDTPATSGYGFTAGFTTATTTGSFPITLTGTNPNYDVVFAKGTLTVDLGATVIATLPAPASRESLNLNVNDTQPNITVYYSPLGFSGDAAAEERAIISEFLSSTGSIMSVDAFEAMLIDPNTRSDAMALLMPYYQNKLTSLLNEPQSQWTTAEAAFVQAFANYVQAQRQAAAQQAEADYQAWTDQQNKQIAAKIASISGIAQADYIAILSANPPVPPGDFLAEAQSGFVLGSNNTAKYVDLTGKLASLNQLTQQYPNTVANMQLQWLFANTTQYLPAKKGEKVQETPEWQSLVAMQQTLSINDPSTQAKMQSELAYLYSYYNGPPISSDSIAKALAISGGVTGALVDVTHMYTVITLVAGVSKSAQAIIKLGEYGETALPNTAKGMYLLASRFINKAPDAAKALVQQLVKDGKLSDDVANDALKIISRGVGTAGLSDDALKTMTSVLRAATTTLEAVGSVTGPVGVALEIIANVLQTATAAISYGSIASYNQQFNDAVSAASKPVTVSDLKGLSSEQLTQYFTAMIAGKCDASTVKTPTWSLTQIENVSL